MKKIAIITSASTSMEAFSTELSTVSETLKNLKIDFQLFNDDLSEVVPNAFLGVCLIGDFHSNDVANLKRITSLVSEFYSLSSPVACIGAAMVPVAQALGSKQVNLAYSADLEFKNLLIPSGAFLVDCPFDDFISDRDCKVISVLGFVGKDKKTDLVLKGISRLTKELVEMA